MQTVSHVWVSDQVPELRDVFLRQWSWLIEHPTPALLSGVVAAFVVAVIASYSRGPREPPSLIDPIPRVYNTLQFLLDNDKFMRRAKNILSRSSLAKFYQGTTLVYLVSGPKNVQTLFGRSHHVNNDAAMLSVMLPLWYQMPKKDVSRFALDKSGRGHKPIPGTADTPSRHRYFFQHEHVHTEYLAKPQYLTVLVERYHRLFTRTLQKYAKGEHITLSMLDLCKSDATKCTINALAGPKLFELTPDFLDRFWAFDDNVFSLAMGFPRWLYPRPYKVHDRFLRAFKSYLDAAWEHFDWNGSDANAAWEPHFGARVMREVAKWLKDAGFDAPYTGAGAIGILVWASSSNVIPTLTWTLMEVCRDPALLHALRDEIAPAYITNPSTGARVLDPAKVASLPLLASVYTEALRMHMNFNVQRHVRSSFELDGYKIPTGATLQAPISLAHYDEGVWGVPGRPADEFWAERHVQYVDADGGKTRVFAMSGRSGSFFPYGGGSLICPGRHFAKQAIMLTVAELVSKFDVEFLEWTALDGTPSDRPARNDARFCGAGAMPPDRDMKVKMTRIE